MNLDWYTIDERDISTYPKDDGDYFTIIDNKIQNAYYEGGYFFERCSIAAVRNPKFWSEIPKHNLPDEVLIDLIQ